MTQALDLVTSLTDQLQALLHQMPDAIGVYNPVRRWLYRSPWLEAQAQELPLPYADTLTPPGEKLSDWATAVTGFCVGWPCGWSPDGQNWLSFKPLPAPFEGCWLVLWEQRQARQRLEMLQQVSEAVNSSLLLDDIFDNLSDVLQTYLPFTEARLVILDETHNRVQLVVNFDRDGGVESLSEDKRFVGTDSLLQSLLMDSAPHCFDSGNWPESLLLPQEEPGSALVGSLINKGVVMGMLALYRHPEAAPLPYSTLETELFQDISTPLALALENARFYIQTQAQASHEFLINQLTRAISQTLTIDAILETAVKELGRVLGVSRCFIQYFNTPINYEQLIQGEPSPLEGRSFTYTLPGTPPMEALNEPLSFWQVEWQAFKLRQPSGGTSHFQDSYPLLNPFVLDDVTAAPPSLNLTSYFEANQVRSWVVIPVQVPDGLMAVLTLHQCDLLRSWLQTDLQLLYAISEHLSLALTQARLFREVNKQKEAVEHTLLELQQTQMQLVHSEKMSVIGQFVAGIAHEVNTPLGSMISNNSTLNQCLSRIETDLKQLEEHLNGQPLPRNLEAKRLAMMKNLLDVNQLAGERITDIVKNLRNFARLDESDIKMANLHEGLDSTLLLMRSSMPAHLTIEKHYAPNLPEVECYPALLNQVFMNLMVNAVHATQDNAKPVLTLETSVVEGYESLAQVTIADNGTGIPAEKLEKIFESGFTTKAAGIGTGLGLALCKRIVEKHYGRIEVASTVGQGSLFRVILPLRQNT